MSNTVDGHLTLFHRLKERRLSLGGGAIDLVCENKLAHDGAGAKLKLTGMLVVHRDTGNITRQEIGRKLDPLESRANRASDRFRQHRLANARHILNKDMATA